MVAAFAEKRRISSIYLVPPKKILKARWSPSIPREIGPFFLIFLSLNLGKIRGFDIRVQLYTVPGQVHYDATRKLVLKGVDGVVFVAGSLKVQRKKNME